MQRLYIHPETPQPRLIQKLAELLRSGGLCVIPLETAYYFVCMPGEKKPLETLVRLRRLESSHQFTVLCRDLSELGVLARVDNVQFRFLKAHTPAPVTFLLEASREVPKRLHHPKKKTVGLRVTDHVVATALLHELGGPLLVSSLVLPNHDPSLPLDDPEEIIDAVGSYVEAVVDCGLMPRQSTSIVDLTGAQPILLREGVYSAQDLDLA